MRVLVSRVLTVYFSLFALNARADDSQLEEVLERISAPSALRIEFLQTKEIPTLLKPLTSKGYLLFQRDNGLLWVTEVPFRSTLRIRSDGMSEYTGLPGESHEELPVHEALQQFSEIFLAMFQGDMNRISDEFNFSLEKSPPLWEIALFPKNMLTKQFIQDFRIHGKDTVTTVSVIESAGGKTSYAFSLPLSVEPISEGEKLLLNQR